MNYYDILMKKRNGEEMSEAEIQYLVGGITDGSMPDYQISAWAMAVYFQGMSDRETRDLAMAMAFSGETMDLRDIQGMKVDKHSTGGVGDKTTMVVIPLVAAAGVAAAKMSGRGLGHTGGTVDKFESIPGFRVEQSYAEFIEQVNRIKAAIGSQTGNLVPADKRLYALRDVTATVESIPLIASSIMSKKLASGADGIVLDVKVGKGAFMKDLEEALKLARLMVAIGKGAGKKTMAVLSDMDQPLGMMVGNALEVKEAIDILQGQGPEDLRDLCLILAAHMLVLAGRYSEISGAQESCRHILESGAALQKFQEIISAQHGKLDLTDVFYGLPQAEANYPVVSPGDGYIQAVDAFRIGRAAMLLGAGREKLGDRIDYAVGIELYKKRGDSVNAGDVVALLHYNDPGLLQLALDEAVAAFQYGKEVVPYRPMVLDTVE